MSPDFTPRGKLNTPTGPVYMQGPFFDVRGYGAVGDGPTDDTVAIQDAINVAASYGGGTVLIPSGTFAISQIKLKSKVCLLGTGWQSVIKCKDSNSASAMIVLNDSGVTYTRVENLFLNGNSANQSGAVNVIDYTTQSGFAGNKVIDCYIWSSSGRGISNASQHFFVDGCFVWQSSQEGIVLSAADAKVTRTNVGNSGYEGVVVDGANVELTDVNSWGAGQVTSTRGDGVKVTGARFKAANCDISDNQHYNWSLYGASGPNVVGGQTGMNSGTSLAPFYLRGAGNHMVRTSVFGANVFTNLLVFDTDGTQYPLNSRYDLQFPEGAGGPAGTNALFSGTVNNSNTITINGHLSGMGRSKGSAALAARNIKGEVFHIGAVAATPVTVDGTVYASLVDFTAGDVVTNLCVIISGAGGTTTLTKMGLYDSAGNRLALTADLGTAWETTGPKSHALTAPYTIISTAAYYIAFVYKGAVQPGPLAGINNAFMAQNFPGGKLSFSAMASQTDLPNPMTIASGGARSYWVGWS